MYIYKQMHMYRCTHANMQHVRTHVCTYVCIWICFVCVYAEIHVCKYVYVFAHILLLLNANGNLDLSIAQCNVWEN